MSFFGILKTFLLITMAVFFTNDMWTYIWNMRVCSLYNIEIWFFMVLTVMVLTVIYRYIFQQNVWYWNTAWLDTLIIKTYVNDLWFLLALRLEFKIKVNVRGGGKVKGIHLCVCTYALMMEQSYRLVGSFTNCSSI